MKPVQELDVVPARRVVRLTVAACVMIALGAILAWLLGDARARALGARLVPNEPGLPTPRTKLRNEIFSATSRPPPAPERLARYGWVDRSLGVVHIPIERAMDVALEKANQP